MSSKRANKMAELARAIGAAPANDETQEAVKPEKQKAVKTTSRARAPRAAAAAAPMRRTGTLKQMTIKLEPDVRSRLLQESLRRKAEDSENWPIQQIVTEAVNAYLGGK